MNVTSTDTPPSFNPLLRPNDLELLRLLAGPFILLTRKQIGQLFPGTSVRNVNYRLRRLIRSGHVSRRLYPTAYAAPQVPLYFLGPKASEALGFEPDAPEFNARRRRALQLRDGALPHFLLVTSVHIRFLVASREYPDVELLSWIDQYDPIWRALNAYGFPLRPDGYAEYRVGASLIRFFLEMDRGTERGRAIHHKLGAYHAYAVSGRFEQHFSAPAFRVLAISTTSRRARQIVRQAPAATPDLFWAASADHFFERPLLDPYWLIPGSDIHHSLSTPL